MEQQRPIEGHISPTRDGGYRCYSSLGIMLPREILLKAAETAPDYSIDEYWRLMHMAADAENGRRTNSPKVRRNLGANQTVFRKSV